MDSSRHEKSHLGQKEHVCSQCDRGFVRKADMERHERTHKRRKPNILKPLKTRPYCAICQLTFQTTQRLTSHLKFTHGNTTSDDNCNLDVSEKPDLYDDFVKDEPLETPENEETVNLSEDHHLVLPLTQLVLYTSL